MQVKQVVPFLWSLIVMFFICRWLHLLFNLLVQVLVGLPLEMVHGSLRIGVVYMAGVLAGEASCPDGELPVGILRHTPLLRHSSIPVGFEVLRAMQTIGF
jgi:membrane associated rhomboid family serine protease